MRSSRSLPLSAQVLNWLFAASLALPPNLNLLLRADLPPQPPRSGALGSAAIRGEGQSTALARAPLRPMVDPSPARRFVSEKPLPALLSLAQILPNPSAQPTGSRRSISLFSAPEPPAELPSLKIEIVPLPEGHRTATLTYDVDTNHQYIVEYRDRLDRESPCDRWQQLPGAPHNSGLVIITPVEPQRFFRLRLIDQPQTGLFALLTHDTGAGANGVVTSNLTLSGEITVVRPGTRLEAALDRTEGPFTKLIASVAAPQHFQLDADRLVELNQGQPLAEGPHVLYLHATDANEQVLAAHAVTFVYDVSSPPLTVQGISDVGDPIQCGDKTVSATVTLTGQTDPGAQVELLPAGLRYQAGSDGRFEIANLSLVLGRNALTLRATDLNCLETVVDCSITRLRPENTCPFDSSLTGWQVKASPPPADRPGTRLGSVNAVDCRAFLKEGDSFVTSLERVFAIPPVPANLIVSYEDLTFDPRATNRIRDAFEIALVDAAGKTLVHTIAADRDACFNVTDGQRFALGYGVQVLTGNAYANTVAIPLRHIPAGTPTRLVFRLVNNDGDRNTQVALTDFRIEAAVGSAQPQARTAGFQPAVSPTSSRQAALGRPGDRPATARPHAGSLRYSRLEVCATNAAPPAPRPLAGTETQHRPSSAATTKSTATAAASPVSLAPAEAGINSPSAARKAIRLASSPPPASSDSPPSLTVDPVAAEVPAGSTILLTGHAALRHSTLTPTDLDLLYGLKGRNRQQVDWVNGIPTHLFSFRASDTGAKDLGTVRLGEEQIRADGLARSSTYGLRAFQIDPNGQGSRLIALNAADARATAIGPFLPGREVAGAVFDLCENLWGIDCANDQLLQIDPQTGEIVRNPVDFRINDQPYDLSLVSDLAVDREGRFLLSDWKPTVGIFGAGAIYTLDHATGLLVELMRDTTGEADNQHPPNLQGLALLAIGPANAAYIFDGNRGDDIYVYPSLPSPQRTRRFAVAVGPEDYNAGPGDLASLMPPTRPSRPPVVTIDSRPVDALDAAGNFFTHVTVKPGTNVFTFTGTDTCGNTASTSLSLIGIAPPSGPIDFTQLVDVAASVTGEYGRTSFDDRTRHLYADLAVRNAGLYAVNTPLLVGIARISDPTVRLLNADGIAPDGTPYLDFSDLASGATLQPGDQTAFLTVAFANPHKVQFTYDLVVLGEVNRAPRFTTVPVLEAHVGMPYAYTASATDPDGDPLTFTVVASPPGLAINPQPSTLNWSPGPGDLGTHSIRLRTEDGHGGWAEQSYVLSVTEPPPNRPPYFTSVPIVEAFVNRAYVYNASAADPDNDPVTFALPQAPAGMTLPTSPPSPPGVRTLEWLPTADHVGTHHVTVEVADGRGGTATQRYQIAVHPDPANHGPVIVSEPVTGAVAGQPYSYNVEAIDPNADVLKYSLSAAPPEMTIDPASGLITWPAPQVELSPEFAFTFGGSDTQYGFDDARELAVDAQNNYYVTGNFSGTPDFDPDPVRQASATSVGDGDSYLAKYSSRGQLIWVRAFGANRPDGGYGITLDKDGNVWLGGQVWWSNAFDLDPGPGVFVVQPVSDYGIDNYVAKFDPNGMFLLGARFSGYGLSVAADPSGAVWFTGTFVGTADYDPGPAERLLSAPSGGSVLLKFSLDGQLLWASALQSVSCRKIACDLAGNAYASGHFSGTVDVDPGPGEFKLTSAGSDDNFVIKLNPNGELLWARSFGGPGSESSLAGVTTDPEGNLYINGVFRGSVDFDPGPGVFNLTSAGAADVFFVKLDSQGGLVWARRLGGAQDDFVFYGNPSFRNGQIHFNGGVECPATYGAATIAGTLPWPAGAQRFVASLDADGNFISCAPIGGSAVAQDGQGSIIVGGVFAGTRDFDPGPEQLRLTAAHGKDAFLSKYKFVSPVIEVTARVEDGRGGSDEQHFKITVTPTLLPPDLIIGNVNRDALTVDPQTLAAAGTITATVTNLGPGTAAGPFDVLFFEDVNHNGVYDTGTDTSLGSAKVQNSLSPSAKASVIAPVAGAVTFPGTFIWAFVDSGKTVAEKNEANNVARNIFPCQYVPPVGQFNPVIKWKKDTFSVIPESKQVIMTPVVIDLNSDSIPDIVFATLAGLGGSDFCANGVLRAVNGADGSELWTVDNPAYRLVSGGGIAVGDIDHDGFPEIVGVHESRALISFSHDGKFKWLSTTSLGNGRRFTACNLGAPVIADLNQDGVPEIVFGSMAFDNSGRLLWQGSSTGGIGNGDNAYGPLSLVADVDLDGRSEIVAGTTVYRADGSVLWNASIPDGFPALGNFDDDPYPEIVVVAEGNLYLLEHSGTAKWGPVAIPGGGLGGAPTVADVDGDGQLEIGVAGAVQYVVFDAAGRVKWQTGTRDTSSHTTGSTVFDFEGDGRNEVLYADELYFRIYEGSTGHVLYSLPRSSCTAYEYPVVADVDADGNSEIVVIANAMCGYGSDNGLYVIGDANDTWVPTRQIWNQHTYHINNINDDGTIPRDETNSWLTHNTYRCNLFTGPGGAHAAPDLLACYVRMSQTGGQTTITARIGNGGELLVGPGIKVAFYSGNPQAGGVLIGVATTTARIEPGCFEDVGLTITGNPPADLWVVADDDGTGKGQVNECDEGNNRLQPILSDLIVGNVDRTGLTVDPQTLAAAGTVTATVTNVGPGTAAGPFDVLVFEDVNHNGAYDAGTDTALGTSTVAGPLANGATAHVTAHVAGAVTFPGTFIWAFVDSGNSVAEENEANNVARKGADCPYMTPNGPVAAADLAPCLVRVVAEAGQTRLTARIGNGGEVSAPAGVKIGFYNGNPTAGGILLGSVQTTKTLPPDDFEDVSLLLANSTFTDLWVVVDDDGSYDFSVFDMPGYTVTAAMGLNSAGQVVGQAGSSNGFLLDSGVFSKIDCLAFDINDRGEILGFCRRGALAFLTTLADVGIRTQLSFPGLPGNRTLAMRINNAAEVVGYYADPNVSDQFAVRHGFWRSADGAYVTIDYPNAPHTWAHGNNDLGQIVGQWAESSTGDAHGWSRDAAGHFTTVDVPGAKATSPMDVNNFGQICGSFYDRSGGIHGFIRDAAGQFTVLDVSGATYTELRGINDAGQVAGEWWNVGSDHQQGFVGTRTGMVRECNEENNRCTVPGGSSGTAELHGTVFNDLDNDTLRSERVIGGFARGRTGIIDAANAGSYSVLRERTLAAFPGTTFVGWNELTDAFLASVDLVVLATAGPTVLSDSEQAALKAFVLRGGGAILLVDNDSWNHGDRENASNQSFAKPFELHVTGKLDNPAYATVPRAIPNLTGGPFGDVRMIVTGNPGWFDALGPWAARVADFQGGQCAVAAISPHMLTNGSGGVVLVSDFNAFDNFRILSDDNLALALNAMAFVSPPADEPGLPGWVVYLDGNGNSRRDAGERFAVSDSKGAYSLTGLLPSTYLVAQEPQAGWHQTAPAAGNHSVTVAAGQVVTGVDFGNKKVEVPPEPAPNQPPRFISHPPASGIAGETLIYHAVANDADGDALTFDLSLKPDGMAVDPHSGTVVWTPSAAREGVHQVALRVRDPDGAQDVQVFEIHVTRPNTAPEISSRPSAPAYVGRLYQYQVRAQDAENDPISFQLDTAPAGMVIGQTNGLLSWIPEAGCVGTNRVVVRASDSRGAWGTQAFGLPVVEAKTNQAPTIVSKPRQIVELGQSWLYQVQATDPDNDPLTYALNLGPTNMVLDTNGLAVWTPTPEQFGTNKVQIQVTDPGGLGRIQSFGILVVTRATNSAPAILSEPRYGATVDQLYAYDPVAQDPDGDPLIFELADQPLGMSIDMTTGALRWTPTLAQLGTNNFVSLRVLDASGASYRQSWWVYVRAANLPPLITSSPTTTAVTNEWYYYAVDALDPEGGGLSVALVTGPINMTLNATNGLIEWLPVAAHLGTNRVRIEVADAEGATTPQEFEIVVGIRPNGAPFFHGTIPIVLVAETNYVIQLNATDPDGDALTYGLSNPPAGMSIDPSTGTIRWTPQRQQAGGYDAGLSATDPGGLKAMAQWQFRVVAQNRPPSFTLPVGPEARVNIAYGYDVRATDPDGDPLHFELAGQPAGMTINDLGQIRWLPGNADAGPHTITVRVTDPVGNLAEGAFTLTVRADTTPPYVRLGPVESPVWVGTILDITAVAQDASGQATVTLTVSGVPVPLDATGRGSVEFNREGTFELVATARDAAGNEARDTATVVVRERPPPDPTATALEITSPTDNATIHAPVAVLGTAGGPNLRYFTLAVARLEDGQAGAFREFARGSNAVVDGVLGRFDPTLLQNDVYRIQLTAYDADGSSRSTFVDVAVAGDLKVGNFRLSFTDLSIPVNGFPITVTRTYDTLQAHEDGEFGYGWRLEFRNMRLRTTLPKPSAEEEEIGLSYYPAYQYGSRVFVTMPGGKRQTYTFRPRIKPGLSGWLARNESTTLWIPAFEAERGVTDALTVPDPHPDFALIDVDGDFKGLNQRPYNPADRLNFGGKFHLQTKEGVLYVLDANSGELDTITDPKGNTNTYRNDSIISSTGVKVQFERDPQGRITSVIDPNGARIRYAYDARGDLVSVTDRATNVTRFVYNTTRPHYLDEVKDPLDRIGVRVEYGPDGRLQGMADAGTNRVRLLHDLDRSIEQVVDTLGHTNTFYYDEWGNVTAEVNALGAATVRAYDDANNMTVEIDPLGNTNRFEYDSRGNVTKRIDALGNATFSTYNQYGQVLTTVDPLGNGTRNEYDRWGNLTATVDAAGNLTRYGYDGQGNQTALIDAAGHTNYFGYDFRGNRVSQTDALGNVTSYTYDANGNQTSQTTVVTVRPGEVRTNTTVTAYDGNGRPISATDAAGNITRTEYDALGKTKATVDALSHRTEFEYDERGQLTRTLFADGTFSRLTYDAAGRRTSSTDRAGRTTFYEYDALGRLISTVYPDDTPADLADNPRTQTYYDLAGRVIVQTDERTNSTWFGYDALGRQTSVTNALGYVTRSEYDPSGRKIADIDALLRKTQLAYDELGRRIQTQFADATTKRTLYDALGRVVAEVDQAGVTNAFGYDALGRLTSVTNALGTADQTVTAYAYNEAGNLVRQQDANGHVSRYEYETCCQRSATILPLGQRSTTLYNAVNNVSAVTNFNGQFIAYDYDVNNRLAVKTLPGGVSVRYGYTPTGRRAAITNSAGVTTWTYDARDRLLSRTDPDGRGLEYAYDQAGNRTRITTFANHASRLTNQVWSFTFDALNRLETVADAGGTNRYTYDPANNLAIVQLANGTSRTNFFDALNRVTNIFHAGPTGVFASFRYTVAPTGNRRSVQDSTGRTVAWDYDALNRLTRETVTSDPAGQNYAASYVYDAVGNRLYFTNSLEGVTAYQYDDNDQLLTESKTGVSPVFTTYTYDSNGNTLSRSNATESAVYAWTAENRLSAATVTTNGVPRQLAYAYDDDGIRVAASVTEAGNTTATAYLVDANRPFAQVLEEWTSLNAQPATLNASYTYGHQMLAQNRAGVRTYYHADHLGSTRALTGQTGSPTDGYAFDAYGRTLRQTGSTANDYLFAGEQRDKKLGLDYLRARYLSARTGRFYGRDPLQGSLVAPRTQHGFVYSASDPVNNIDPSGQFLEQLFLPAVIDAISSAFFRPKVPQSMIDKFEKPLRIERAAEKHIVTKYADCNLFLRAVARELKITATDLPDSDADGIIGHLQSSTKWTSLQGTGREALYEAILRASRGEFVVAGATGSALGQSHGHVSVLVRGTGYSGSLDSQVPLAYWGRLNAANVNQAGRKERISQSYPVTPPSEFDVVEFFAYTLE